MAARRRRDWAASSSVDQPAESGLPMSTLDIRAHLRRMHDLDQYSNRSAALSKPASCAPRLSTATIRHRPNRSAPGPPRPAARRRGRLNPVRTRGVEPAVQPGWASIGTAGEPGQSAFRGLPSHPAFEASSGRQRSPRRAPRSSILLIAFDVASRQLLTSLSAEKNRHRTAQTRSSGGSALGALVETRDVDVYSTFLNG